VGLRPVRREDIEVFYEHQLEPAATAMAGFPSRGREAFFAHWERTLVRPDARVMTITEGDAVAGNIGSWADDGRVLLGYWTGSAHWGRGVATAAVREYLAAHEPRRPVYAYVAATNGASVRVLEKCGFAHVERDDAELLLVFGG
jgi:RimJ/RimL family protein N-acetyltransferase